MKQTFIYIGVFLLAGGVAFYFFHSRPNINTTSSLFVCSQEIYICPDGSTVGRLPPTCEFALCPAITASSTELKKLSGTSTATTTNNTPAPVLFSASKNIVNPKTNSPSFISSLLNLVGIGNSQPDLSVLSNSAPDNSTTNNTTQIIQSNNSPNNPNLVQSNYSISDGNIVSGINNSVVYEIPPSVEGIVNQSPSDWESHIVDIIPVNEVTPIIGGIPVIGSQGKYYLSENSYGNIENCEFSNKIFILDTNTNEVTLMYEENSNTLSRDDPRSCNSEIFLLATEDKKLIIKYHTLGTNTICDSDWSEPEKTWYLDVTSLIDGMRKYHIDSLLSNAAEQKEADCRAGL